MGISFALAAILITSPPSDPAPSAAAFFSCAHLAQAMAVELEILDPREVRYVLARPADFAADIAMLRRRWQDLHDAPALHDAMRFPDRALINDMLTFNRAYHVHLDARQAHDLLNWWELREALQEVDRLYQIWDTVRDARCDYYYVTVRRQALKKTRETIGSQAWASGCLPPHVPVWRFQRIE